MKGCRPGQHIVLPPHIRIAITATRGTLPDSDSSTETGASTKASATTTDNKGTNSSSINASLARWVHYALPSKESLLEEMELLKQLAKDPTPSQVGL